MSLNISESTFRESLRSALITSWSLKKDCRILNSFAVNKLIALFGRL